jgi:hypothetical protein
VSKTILAHFFEIPPEVEHSFEVVLSFEFSGLFLLQQGKKEKLHLPLNFQQNHISILKGL